MAAQKVEREQIGSQALRLAALALISLFVMLLLLIGTARSASASYHSENHVLRPAIPMDTTTVAPTDTPPSTSTPTVEPTATATAIATATVIASAPTVPVTTPANNGNNGGGAGPGTSGPQPTRVVLSQPTVGAGSSSPLQGLSPSNFGTNGLLVATTLSCVVALLGIIVGAIALYALVQSGYGPFLRALALGKRNSKRQGNGRPRRQSSTTHFRYRDDTDGGLDSRRQPSGRYGGGGNSGANSGKLPPRLSQSGTGYARDSNNDKSGRTLPPTLRQNRDRR